MRDGKTRFLSLLLSALLLVLSPVLTQSRPRGLPARYKLRWSRGGRLWRIDTVDELYEDLTESLAGVLDGHDLAVQRAVARC